MTDKNITKTKKLLIPFFTAGFPALDSTTGIIESFDEAGVDYIEIGLAHSDALADGPVIQKASHQALLNGINTSKLFEQISKIKVKNSKLILFSYYNPLLAYGLEKLVRDWKAAGGSAILVPDLPYEESEELLSLCSSVGLKLIFLIAPTSTEERIKKIAEISEEFIYLVSVTGVTGARDKVSENLGTIIQKIKSFNPEIKVVIGFGISGAEQALAATSQGADGVVIGSAIVKLLEQKGGVQEATDLLLEIKKSLL
ncbi:MAG: tryptophan synthase subunit alpha [Candidatus Melainabacteria bacterium]|jgi:tryptophan synthase alpha chain